ncbi:LacI family DNA-binding transcriptional regulator [Methylovirgula sp. 4M-Z18]|uniref:LacI family DNA-binding transcriptional regulator n=1 Tax=Methylovirgula sp. 4M-Z18 TaxID=2293567 RepID=UPI000E2F63C2|nr:LacI family DNA-binding transcriptional regulator [Methylovirgula sp. 4M-Z18]RFB79954.1 LacI family transcriptional regulator [Methylovirgula sp. 4M-Z18]
MTTVPSNPTTGRAATLQSIATAAGVHRSTAARALDPAQSHRISPEVVERVRHEAQRQGYRRDTIAASLRTGRSSLVGVLLPDLGNPVFAPILDGIGLYLAERGYSMLVTGGADEASQIGIVEELMARRVDGLVLATVRRDDPVVTICLAAGLPTVLVNRGEDDLRTASVVTDDMGGMALAVDHLVSLGHRRIGHLAGPQSLSTGALRRQGFENAMTAAGLDPCPIVTATAYSRDAGEAATALLLNRYPHLTAIAAGNDLLALGAYLDVKRRGLTCPGDISIVGHNDMPLVDMVDPPLTTIHIGHREMGASAAALLLERIGTPSLSPVRRLASAELIVRASTKQLARADTAIGF